MPLKALAFDWGHTLMDERRDADIPLETRPIHLMPGVAETMPRLDLPLALWANTRIATEADARIWLDRAGLERYFRWVVTSVDAGARKPARAFFDYAVGRCGVSPDEILFVGNQLNADVAGGESYGIRTVWLSGPAYRSEDDRAVDTTPTYTILTMDELPELLRRIAEERLPGSEDQSQANMKNMKDM
jgi:FMN phosphatase YigB (HAD superfamily)